MKNLTKALSIGVLKIMSKMGVSTIMSYRGAQLFEAVGLEDPWVAAQRRRLSLILFG